MRSLLQVQLQNIPASGWHWHGTERGVPTGMQGIVSALRRRPESGILRMCDR